MSKGGLALSSLVMAIPAGLLAYLSIRSVFEMNEKMPTLVTVIVWALIVICVLLAISPIIFLIAGPKAAPVTPGDAVPEPVDNSQKLPAKKKPKDDDEFADEDGDADGGEDEQLFDTSDDEAGAEEFEDNFNFDEDEEEEPAPKKKKKK